VRLFANSRTTDRISSISVGNDEKVLIYKDFHTAEVTGSNPVSPTEWSATGRSLAHSGELLASPLSSFASLRVSSAVVGSAFCSAGRFTRRLFKMLVGRLQVMLCRYGLAVAGPCTNNVARVMFAELGLPSAAEVVKQLRPWSANDR
jgi:hypothetical protein